MDPDRIDFYEERINGVTVIKGQGVIDEYNSYWLEMKFEELMKKKDYKLVIDMGNLIFSGAIVWGMVLSQMWMLSEKGGGLKLAAMNKDMENTFNKMEFGAIFEAYGTKQEALSSFRAQ
jgi:anti-anti-sigma factor